MKGIWTYGKLLPEVREDCRVTLGEGGTPLLESRRIGLSLGLEHLYFKLENVNPSGSYKDRFAAGAVSHLLAEGAAFCLATSSGNTGSALAAYCAAVNMPCFIAIVDGVPSGKLRQMQAYGAKTLVIQGFGKNKMVTEEVFSRLDWFAHQYGSGVQISAYRYCPQGMAGVQTIAYEIAEELGGSTGHVFSPAGGGGLALALAKGFHKWKQGSAAFKPPRIHCVQPEGNNTIAGPLHEGLAGARSIGASTTSISGLMVPSILDGDQVIAECRATGGDGYLVTDEQICHCQKDLATMEGIYCEPAGAVALAGLMKALKEHAIRRDDYVVCLITGHGFKDPVSAERMAMEFSELYFKEADDAFQFLKGNF